jgi:PTS system galactitol-specific IIA component
MEEIKMNTIKNIEISEDLIITKMDSKSNVEALKLMSESLFKNNYAKDCFFEKVIEREKNFPTGIKTKSIGIAIPHTQPEFVNKSSICVGILNKPIIFHQMTNENGTVEVSIIFLLALTDANKHVNVLQNLVKIIKNESLLNSMLKMSKKEIVELLDKYIN